MKQKIILIGGGGHCKSCIDVVEQNGIFEIAGIIERPGHTESRNILGYPILGTDDDLSNLRKHFGYALITIGQIETPENRKRIYHVLKNLKYSLPLIVSPKAYVSKHAKIGEGTIIMHHAFVNTGAIIGKNCIINTKSLVEHDTVIEDHCHIATAAVISGNVELKEGAYIGTNAAVLQGKSVSKKLCIGAYSTVGAGAVVTKNVAANTTVIGIPARLITRHQS